MNEKPVQKTADRKPTIIVVILTAFATAFSGSSLNLSVPSIAADFNVSASLVGWLVTVYALSVAAFSVPFGRAADITSRKKILIIGTGIFTACCALSIFAWSFIMLIILRLIQGIGAAMVFSTNTAIIISAFPPNMRGRAIGYSLVGTYVGLSSGPVIGGIMNHQLGWRSIFVLTSILTLAALILAIVRLPAEEPPAKKRPFDLTGNLLFIVFITAFMFGLSQIIGHGIWPFILIAAGLAAGILFVIHEAKEPDPAVQVRLFKDNIGFGLSNLSALLNYATTMALSYLMSIYLQVVAGYSSQTAGFIMVCQPVAMALLSPRMGRLSDRISPFKLSSAGMAVSGAGITGLIFVGPDTSAAVIVAMLLIIGIGFAMFSSPNTNAIMSCVDKKDYGVASSLVSTMRTVGQTVGMVIVTLVVSFHLGSTPLASSDPDVVVKVTHILFIIFAVICAVGVVISLQRGKGK
ncbi:MAG: MFS transporter [Bacillota bacterium]|nr:MFS transporter [Bacillota bacterium]